jgi:tetratricopeptide (TPR) repeat protein
MQESTINPASVADDAMARAVESLKAHLMPPNDAIPFRWSRDHDADAGMNINQIYLLSAAWCLIDPQVAEDLVKSALSCQREDGLIPAHTQSGEKDIAWPLLAQSARQVWNVTKNPAFAEYCLPRLERYLSRVLDYYDPRGTGIPRWRTAGEMLEPDLYHPDVAHVDLISLLTSEIEAYEQLALAVPSAQVHRSILAVEQTQFLSHLITLFWDRSKLVFKDRFATGAAVERTSYTHILPWLCESLPSIYRQAGWVASFTPSVSSNTGTAAYVLYFLILECYRKASFGQELSVLRDKLLKTLEPLRQGTAPLHPAAASLLLVAEKLPVHPQKNLIGPSKLAIKLDNHRPLFFGAVALLIVILGVILFFTVFAKRQPPLQSMEAIVALARQNYAQGNYDEAIQIYSDLMKRSGSIMAVEMGLANAYFKKGQYQEAETHYRNLLQAKRAPPSALLNLAATLYRQGRREEAYECYKQFDEQYGRQYIELSARARLAMELLREQGLVESTPAAP